MSTISTNKILEQAYEYVSEDNLFLRLTTISTIVHSMIFLITILYNLNQIIGKLNHQRSSIIIKEVIRAVTQITQAPWFYIWVIVLGIIVAIGYYIFPPIGEAAMIHHLEKSFNNKSGSSFSHGMKKFFVMFERNSLLWFISIPSWLIIMSRVWILDVLQEPIIIPIIIIYTLVVFVTVLVTPYVKFKLVVEQETFAVAIKESIFLAISQPTVTLRLALISFILNLRIILNIIILVWVPVTLFYLAYMLNLHQTTGFYITLVWLIVGLFFLIAYINSIVEAFFMTFRYLWYRSIEPSAHQ